MGSRERGAQIADIAILIVSAEEGVKDQTKESFRIIEESKVPFIVAINKIDKTNANVEKVKQELIEIGVYVEGYGGDVHAAAISSKSGEGVSELLDIIVLLAELENLTADNDTMATGFILESEVSAKQGVVARAIIKNGTLTVGDFFVAGHEISKIKRIDTFNGKSLPSAQASMPVTISGLSVIAYAGDEFSSFKTKKEAECYANEIIELTRKEKDKLHIDENDERITVPIIIKTDVLGTLEALKNEIPKYENERIAIRILSSGVGTIGEADIKLASSGEQALVIGFNVPTDKGAQELAEQSNVTIHTFYKVHNNN